MIIIIIIKIITIIMIIIIIIIIVISWCGNFVEKHSFHIVLSDWPHSFAETVPWKLLVFRSDKGNHCFSIFETRVYF